MSVILFAENSNGTFKKGVFEAATYARKTADMMQMEAYAITVGEIADEEAKKLGAYGIQKVLKIASPTETFHTQVWVSLLKTGFETLGGKIGIIANTYCGKSVAPGLAVHLQAGLVSNVVALPEFENGTLTVKKGVFSGKGFAMVSIQKNIGIIAFVPNSIEASFNECDIDIISAAYEAKQPSTTVEEVNTVQGKIPLTEATLVVSAGRGLKGPENWHLVENLADALGAATACSKPVSDMGWRPHAEHVGQTGITIKPNLYIAIGISGAIQHLAGVSSSKVIVAINKDPEAPFFKAADYGIVGDAFDILPKLTACLKATAG